jgi:geranylgeranyl diphosphate synthase type II
MVAITKLNFSEFFASRRALVEDQLIEYLSNNDPPDLWESMRYSVLSGGKRLRALLCLAAAEAVGGDEARQKAIACACAIEFVHAFSLIHDDLPAMDNDDFRRGRPTNHKVYGEAMAILAGDALFALAMEVLVTHTPQAVEREALLAVTGELVKATGSHGMVGGQVSDMALTGRADMQIDRVDPAVLESMHRRKTGALIKFSLWSGAKLASADANQLSALGRFGEILGLAFQIADDLLDVTGEMETLGKTPGKDEASGKTTWVRVFGVEESRARLRQLHLEGRQALQSASLEQNSLSVLEALLDYAINRSN